MINHLPKNLAKLSDLCQKETAYASKWAGTTGVHLECEGWHYEAIATNGRILGLVKGTETEEGNEVKALTAAPNTANKAIVGAKDWSEAFKLIGKRGATLGCVLGEKTVTFGAADMGKARTLEVEPVDGRFPDAKLAIPRKAAAVKVFIDPEYLIAILKAAQEYTTDDNLGVYLELRDATTPVVVRAKNASQEFTGVAMPLSEPKK